MSKQISIWALLFSVVLSYVFAIVFIYFLFTFWIVWIAPIQSMIVIWITYLINSLDYLNISIKFVVLPLFVCCYYYVCFLSIIYIHNKHIKSHIDSNDTHILRTRQE